MENFARIIYQQFLMRDLLGKFAPGLIFLISLQHALSLEAIGRQWQETASLRDPWLWIIWVAAIPTCLVVGLALQTLGELTLLQRAAPRPWPSLALLQTLLTEHFGPIYREAYIDFWKRLHLFRAAHSDGRLKDDAVSQRERFVALKEATGNFALALLAAILSVWYRPPAGWPIEASIALTALAGLLWYSECLFASRQALYEIGVLERIGAINGTIAKEMTDRLPRWLVGQSAEMASKARTSSRRQSGR